MATSNDLMVMEFISEYEFTLGKGQTVSKANYGVINSPST